MPKTRSKQAMAVGVGCHSGNQLILVYTKVKAPTTPLDLSGLIGLSVFQLNLN
jgi:hypothetical protein